MSRAAMGIPVLWLVLEDDAEVLVVVSGSYRMFKQALLSHLYVCTAVIRPAT